MEDPLQSIEQKALRLLTAREHSAAELRRKLLARGFEAADVEQVLAGLAARRLLSDERFAEAYVEERMRKGYGPLRIRAELRERGVDADLADRCLARDEETWMEILALAHGRKFGPGGISTRSELARRARFLEYRGFTAAQVGRFLNLDD